MSKLKIVAVGSSPIIANEIKNIAQSFLGTVIPIICTTTDQIHTSVENAFYICAVTQQEKLSAVIPTEQLFVFDLHPTTKFFLDIAKIPANSSVLVFNNLLPYTKLLASECQALGICSLDFTFLAYEENSPEAAISALQQAQYIIGVDCLIENVLKKAPFVAALRKDAIIIGGQRTASIASAGNLLAAIAKYYLNALNQGQPVDIVPVICALKTSSTRLITSNLGTSSPSDEAIPAIPTNSQEQIALLSYLQGKFSELFTTVQKDQCL